MPGRPACCSRHALRRRRIRARAAGTTRRAPRRRGHRLRRGHRVAQAPAALRHRRPGRSCRRSASGRRRPARRGRELPQPRADRAHPRIAQPVPPGQQNLSEAALFLQVGPGQGRPGPADRVRPRPVRHHRRPGPPELGQHPAGRRPAALARLGQARQRRSDGQPLVNPNYLGDRSDLDRLADGGQDLARDLRDQGVRAVGRRRADARADVRRPTTSCGRSSERTPTPTTTRPARARWALDDLAVVDPSCGSAASRGCASPMRASCPACHRATATPAS